MRYTNRRILYFTALAKSSTEDEEQLKKTINKVALHYALKVNKKHTFSQND